MPRRFLRSAVLPTAMLALGLALAGCAADGRPLPAQSAIVTPEPGETAVTLTAPGASEDCEGIGVIIDAGDLDAASDPSTESCIPVDESLVAADALAAAGVETEGTADFGDQVVCRVNGAPAETDTITATDGTEYHETCQSMPAAFAYWSIWVQPADGEWGYAQEGLATQELQPGDRLGLFFTLNDQPASPAP